MKKMISLLVLLTIYFPTYAGAASLPPADHWVIVNFDGDCPTATRVGTATGNGNRCLKNNKKQADAVCVFGGDIIEWRRTGGNVEFEITEKNGATSLFNNSCTRTTNPPNRIRCTVAATSGEHHYNIETDTCVLDPRILLN